MVNEKPVTDNGFRFCTTCTHKHTASCRRCNFGDTWIRCHSKTLVKTPLFGEVGHGQYHHQIRRQRFGAAATMGRTTKKVLQGYKEKKRD